jgi:polysaccharide biosynthesis/export protein
MNRLFLFCFLVLSISSCIPYKDIVLFRKNEAPLPDLPTINTPKNTELTIQTHDALAISVTCIDPQLAAPFNMVDTRTSGQILASSPFISYLVDSKGEIDFPILGKIAAGRLTISQLKDTLHKKIKPYIKEASINIRRVNFRVSVLGEVVKPGSFDINSERITILEALALAGDLTPYSDRQRIMVTREENGKIISMKLDLQSADFYNSPFYYLHQNDVVYVDPKKSKKGGINDPANKYISWGTAGLTAVSTIVTVLVLLLKK